MPRTIILLILSLLLTTSLSVFNPACLLCHDIVKLVQKGVKRQPFEVLIEKIAILVCAKKTSYPPNVCKGAVKEMTGIILTAFWQHHTDPHTICPSLKLCSKEYQKRVLKDDIAKILAGKMERDW